MEKSESVKNLAIALAKFQNEVKDPRKDKNNPFFKSSYVALDGLMASVRPVLSKYGLSILQAPASQGDGAVSLQTMIMHESGEFMIFPEFMIKAAKNDAQSLGSAITYARRYALSTVLGVAWDNDDDGNAGTFGTTAQTPYNANTRPTKAQNTYSNTNTPKTTQTSSEGNYEQKGGLLNNILSLGKEKGMTMQKINEFASEIFNKKVMINQLTVDELKKIEEKIKG